MAISAELMQDAETQLLEFLRGRDLSSFSVTIVCGNDKWIISTTDNESGAYCIGQGPTFADAWHDRTNQILTPVRQPLKRASWPSTSKTARSAPPGNLLLAWVVLFVALRANVVPALSSVHAILSEKLRAGAPKGLRGADNIERVTIESNEYKPPFSLTMNQECWLLAPHSNPLSRVSARTGHSRSFAFG